MCRKIKLQLAKAMSGKESNMSKTLIINTKEILDNDLNNSQQHCQAAIRYVSYSHDEYKSVELLQTLV